MVKRTKPGRGAVAVQVAFCLIPIMGIAAICVDGGLLLQEQRHAQAAADAAALAAAADLYNNYRTNNGVDSGGTAAQSAVDTAAANGCSSSEVQVHIPPTVTTVSAFKQPGYAEVVVTINVQRTFSAIFSLFGSLADLNVSARAVARGRWVPFANGVVLLDPTGNALSAGGNGNMTLTASGGASVVVDSNNSSAVSTNGTNASLTAPEFDVTGQTSGNGIHGTVNTGVPPIADPLAYLPPPAKPGQAPAPTNSGSVTYYSPGLYTSDIKLTGGTNVFQPGIYYLQGSGISLSGQAVVSGSGVMIYSDSGGGSFRTTGSWKGSLDLSPPTSGIYEGITFFLDRSSTASIDLAGNGNWTVAGTIYAPNATVNLSGKGDILLGGQLIAKDLSMQGNGAVTINYSADNTARTRIVGLVE